jgi:hypothetical protein
MSAVGATPASHFDRADGVRPPERNKTPAGQICLNCEINKQLPSTTGT